MSFHSPLPPNVMRHHDLFKYRPLRHDKGEEHEHTRSIFEHKALWFARPASFNDPFDCDLRMLMGHVPEHLLEAACVAVAKEHPRLSKKAVERLVRKLTKKPRAFDHILEEKRRVIREDSSVCCWAGNGVSVTMYGYYADSHHGICLQFRIEHRHQLGQVLPVNYVPDYPKLNYGDLARDPDLAKYLMFTKAQTWEHEEERRVFRYDEREGRVNFEPQQLVRIIFGVKCSDHDIGMVKNWINNWPCPVVLARAKAQEAAFALRIVDFETVGDD